MGADHSIGRETSVGQRRENTQSTPCAGPNEIANFAPDRNEEGYRLGEPFTLDNIDAAMAYHPWSASQVERGDIVREALAFAAKAILRAVPAGPYRSVAIRKLLEARMDANAAITFRGRF